MGETATGLTLSLKPYQLVRVLNAIAAEEKSINRPSADDLDTAYSEIFARLIDKINTEYIRLLREILAEELPGFRVIDTRENAFSLRDFMARIFDIENLVKKKNVFGNVYDAMQSVFVKIDDGIKRGIVKDFNKNGYRVPEVQLKQPSMELKRAFEANAGLIKDITERHMKNLSGIVAKATRGAADFKGIVSQVMEQSDKGKRYAMNVAKDQTAKAYAAISEERQKHAGYPNFEWLTVNIPPTPMRRKGEVRPDHWRLRNKIFAWGNLPKIDGREVKPGSEVFCRCKAKGTFRPVTG